jgi:MFS family permease
VASLQGRYGYGLSVILGALVFGAALFGFASAHSVMVACTFALGIGLCLVVYQTQNQTLLQFIAPRHIRGRVMSIYLLNRGLVPLGTILAGGLAERFGGPRALQIMSLLATGVVLGVVLLVPRILALRVEFRDSVPE